MPEVCNEAYKSKCLKRLREWGVPIEGWYNTTMIDNFEQDGRDA
jgi:hypothetical protein